MRRKHHIQIVKDSRKMVAPSYPVEYVHTGSVQGVPKTQPPSVTDEPHVWRYETMRINLIMMTVFGKPLNVVFVSLRYKSTLYIVAASFLTLPRCFVFIFVGISRRD